MFISSSRNFQCLIEIIALIQLIAQKCSATIIAFKSMLCPFGVVIYLPIFAKHVIFAFVLHEPNHIFHGIAQKYADFVGKFP